jgi:hypothetical protein
MSLKSFLPNWQASINMTAGEIVMPKPQNAMEIFQLLDKSNCQECGRKTCMAFAGAVYMGQKSLRDCPRLAPEVIARVFGEEPAPDAAEQNREDYMQSLVEAIRLTDLAAAARRIGARFEGGRLRLKILGKNFSVDTEGRLAADIHVNPWVAVPFLHHVLHGKGVPPTGNWVSLRELAEGKERYPLFQKRCEAAMQAVADTYPDLFKDMVQIFNGRRVERQFESDISVVLAPLPRVPIMVCYWRPEDGMASSLKVFYDATADQNLDIGALFTLGVGLAAMFEKLALRHGFSVSETQV